jgi:phage terminase large subunit GpA-like protein
MKPKAIRIDVDGEGDPVEIAKRRTDQFTDFKIVEGSTPAKPKGFSRIEKRFEESDQRYFHVPCPFCGRMQATFLARSRDEDASAGVSARCRRRSDRLERGISLRGCEKVIPERYKQQMLDAGRWVAKFPGRAGRWFRDLNALYSPWRDIWPDLADEWVKAQRNPEKLKAFINLRLGETWEEQGFSLEPHDLRRRCEIYGGEREPADVPKGVGLLTAAADVQDDRLVAVVKGWGAEEESWLIAYEEFFGDPGQQEVWNQLDEFLRGAWKHASGRMMAIAAVFVDSGGHHTDEVYKFVKVRQARRIFACKGSSESGKEILQKFTQNNSYRVRLYMVGTDTAKDRIFSRLQIPAPGLVIFILPSWAKMSIWSS